MTVQAIVKSQSSSQAASRSSFLDSFLTFLFHHLSLLIKKKLVNLFKLDKIMPAKN